MDKFYFNGTGQQSPRLTNRIMEIIINADKYVKAGNLFFSNEIICRQLISAADRGVALFLLTNLTGAVSRGKTKGKKRTDQSTNDLKHAEALQKLSNRAAAHISGLDGLHAKFIINDIGEGLIMSSNFDENSINSITEAGVDVSGEEYFELEQIFDHIFLRADMHRFQKNGKFYQWSQPTDPINTDILPSKSKLRMTIAKTEYGNGNALQGANRTDIYKEIIDIINDTQESEKLDIVTYSILGPSLRHPEIGDFMNALKNAKARGAKIRLLSRQDKRFGNNQKLWDNYYEIPIQVHKDNHSKIVANEHRGVITTANLMADGLLSNFEAGVALFGEQLNEARKFIEILFNESKIEKIK